MTVMKRVAVVGAGPCGLGAVKALKDEDLDPVCFEMTGHYGGLWRYHEDDVNGLASVMKTTIINTSKELGAASDCPPPAEYPNYMHHTLMYKYIGLLGKKFDLLRHIRYFHQVVKIEPASDYQDTGRWVVTTKNTRSDEMTSETFDGVTVCIGHHVFPNIPKFPGMEEFKGKIMHTHSLKKVNEFEDQRVVVVGVGNSGMDAAVEISNVAKQVYLSSRRGAWVLPRVGPKGHPFDAVFIRRWVNILFHYLPYSIVCSYSEKHLNERFSHVTYNLKPKHRVWSQHPTVSDILPIKLLSGTVVTRKTIKTFTKSGVIFEGEDEPTEMDSVVLATGYKMKFSFLSDDVLHIENNQTSLYKYMYPPHLPHPTLAILGLIQPNGPGFPVGEMQCRYAARILSGKLSLPSKEEMLEDIRMKKLANRRQFVDSPRHTVQVDFIAFQDELAELIGCKPNFWKMAITDPNLFWALFTGPSLPYQYRLQGPNAWKGARDAILTYKERVRAPLRRKGDIMLSKKSSSRIGIPVKVMLLLPLIWWLLLSVMDGFW